MLARAWLAALLLLLPAAARAGDAAADGLLWVGNSFFYYNNGIIGHASQLMRAGGHHGRHLLAAISGARFGWHDIDSYLGNPQLGGVVIDDQNRLHLQPPGRRIGTVVMMDCSQCPLHPALREEFFAFGHRHAAAARRHGARPVFFMSWAYADRPEMVAPLVAAYRRLGEESGALVIPAAIAFARAQALRPRLPLHAPDRRHPSPQGTYLAAAVSVAAMLDASPEGFAYAGGLDAGQARFLRRIAWEAVQEYRRR